MTKETPVRRRPTLEALKALVMLHDHGGVTAAARKLCQTQPVVTRKLAVFLSAEACGATLLHRHGKSLTLTDAGLAAMPHVRDLVNGYEQLLAYVRGESMEPRVVRLGVGSFAAQHFVPPALAALRKTESSCAVETHILRGEERIRKLARGELQFAIVSHQPTQIRAVAARDSRQSLAILKLAQLAMVVIARRDTDDGRELARLARDGRVPIDALRRFELVGLDRDSGVRSQLLESLANPDEIQFLSGGGWFAAREFVRHGIGVALVPEPIVSGADRQEMVVAPIAGPFAVTYHLIHRQGRLSGGEQSLKQELLRRAN